MVVFAASVDHDQAAQNVQPDLISTLSAMLKHYRQTIASNLQSSLSYCRIKILIGFIRRFNPLPDDRILDWSKFKQFADDILKRNEIENYVPYSIENIVRKQCFPQLYIFSASKCGIVW